MELFNAAKVVGKCMHTQTGRKQHQWAVLPQAFTDSPNLFSHILERVLEEFALPPQINLLQYVNDLCRLDLLKKR